MVFFFFSTVSLSVSEEPSIRWRWVACSHLLISAFILTMITDLTCCHIMMDQVPAAGKCPTEHETFLTNIYIKVKINTNFMISKLERHSMVQWIWFSIQPQKIHWIHHNKLLYLTSVFQFMLRNTEVLQPTGCIKCVTNFKTENSHV